MVFTEMLQCYVLNVVNHPEPNLGEGNLKIKEIKS